MSLRRLWAILRKELRHIYRDRRLLFLVTISPAVMLVAFGYLFSFETSSARLAIFDADRSPQSRSLIAAVNAGSKLVVAGEASGYDDLRRRLQGGEIKLGLVIPAGWGRTLQEGRTAEVQLLGDGADPLTTSVQMARFSASLHDWAAPYRRVQAQGPLVVRSLVWYNPYLQSSHSMVPALLSIVLILPGMAVALALTREKELGSFESLATTPVQAGEYVLGKLIPYMAYGMVGAGLAMAVALGWFRVPFRGDLLLFAALTLAYLAATLGLSLLFASFMSSQSTALRAILLLFLVPSIFLTGILLPIDPDSRLVAEALPATHFVAITRGVFLKALDARALGQATFNLLATGILAVALAILSFRKQVV